MQMNTQKMDDKITQTISQNEEDEGFHTVIEDSQSYSSVEPLLTAEALNALKNDLESKDKEISELKEIQLKLNIQLQTLIEESNTLKTRLIETVSQKDKEIQKLHSESNSKSPSPVRISADVKELYEEKTNLNLSNLALQKENSILKKNNLRLGELIMQRDSLITTLTREREATAGCKEQLNTLQIEKEELQKSNSRLREESIRHTTELQQEKAISLALRQELARIRQEKESLEKDYYRTESALQKSNDSLLSYQQQLNDAVTRRNTLAQMVDDHKKEFHLLESQLLTATDTIAKLQLEFQEADLQRSHWEQMVRCDVERTMQREKEYQEMKEGYKELYIYYMDVKADKERLQRQCEHLASDAELARASLLTYKGSLLKNDKTIEELVKENGFLSNLLKQKEGQMEEAEQYWKKQFQTLVQQVAEEEVEDCFPAFVPSQSTIPPVPKKGGYSYPLPSDHPFVHTTPKETPQKAATQDVRTPASKGTLPTQPLSSSSLMSTVEPTSFTSTSFESLLNDVIKQVDELKKVTEYYESN